MKRSRKELDLSFAKKVKEGRKKGESMQNYKKRELQLLEMERYMINQLEE